MPNPDETVADELKASGFLDPNLSADKKVRIELPIVLPSTCEYGVFVTSRSQQDGITRIVVANPDGEDRDDVALEIRPDGSLYGNTKGWAVEMHDDGPQGMLYIWMCPLCGQPMKRGDRCNSGVHKSPDDGNDSGPLAARSIDVVGHPAFTEQELRFIYTYFQHGEAPSSKSITKKLKPMFGEKRT